MMGVVGGSQTPLWTRHLNSGEKVKGVTDVVVEMTHPVTPFAH